jgi:PAS domain S-box-containing protein
MQLRRAASKTLAQRDEVLPQEKLLPVDLDLGTAINAVVRDNLKPVSTGLGVLYAVLATSHAIVLPKPSALPISLVALATAITLLSFRLALRRWIMPESWAHPLGAATAGLALLNCFLHFYYIPEPRQTTNILLLIVGSGFFFLSTRWLACVVLTALSGWGIMVSMAPPSPDWLHFGFALYMSTVLSVLVHTVRVHILTRIEILRRQDEHRKAELETALAAAEAARREAETSRQDLMQSEARLRLLTNQMPAVLWTTDTELHVTSSLGMGLTALDLQPHEVLEMMRFKYSSTAVIEFLPIAAHRRALAGESVRYEISWKGHTFGCQVEPLHDATRKLIGAIGIAFDITNRKQAEETLRKSEEEIRQLNARLEQRMQTRTAELRESEEKYRVLYEANPSMYFTVDAAGGILSVNSFGAEQLGYTVDELLGQSVLNIFCEEDKAEVLRQMEICLQNPAQLHTWELRKVRKDGSMVWVRETARATSDVNGNLVVFIVCEDITSHKRLEEELQRYTEKLEHLATERAMYIQQLDSHDAWQR